MNPGPNHPGLYVHLPFCAAICPYCDFYVLTGDRRRRHQFVQSLLEEIALCAKAVWPSFVDPVPQDPFDTLYFGGGTPSLLDPEDLQRILDSLGQALPLAPDLWVGLEANPEDVTPRNLEAWEQLGVRFLSLGVQSFDETSLRFLGRAHDSQTCHRSVEDARRSGIETLSLDLIFGLPDQSLSDWQSDLEAALELEPDHLSCYQLSLEAGTPFGFRRDKGQLVELAPDRQADLFFLTHNLLADRGYSAYEISNFAIHPDHRSRHNSKYWNHTPYLGLGPSAHSYSSHDRWWNARKIKPYVAKLEADERPIQDHERLTPAQLKLEHLMLGLRTPSGVDFYSFPDDVGPRLWRLNQSLIDELVGRDLVTVDDKRLIPTLAGLAVAEAIAAQFDLGEP